MNTQRTPKGWKRQYAYGRGVRIIHEATGRCVMRPITGKWWRIYGSDGSVSDQPYRTWIDAVRDADKEARKA